MGYPDLSRAMSAARSLMLEDAELVSVTVHEKRRRVATIERNKDGSLKPVRLR